MDKFTENRDEILHENRPFIPRAEIKYIGWLTRSGAKKSTTSIIIEFARPEDANKTISEGLVWHGELRQCERNPVQDNNEMWLLCSGAPIPGLSIEEGARRTQEVRGVPRRARGMEPTVTDTTRRNGPRQGSICHKSAILPSLGIRDVRNPTWQQRDSATPEAFGTRPRPPRRGKTAGRARIHRIWTETSQYWQRPWLVRQGERASDWIWQSEAAANIPSH
ncbi:hypothetical protein CBER1_09969 [Cercospora berteroae]|uniref:Uncharacterized protein n=1 Tax=Cercospora berteroae TaxID=357750 RepID=A0A2S6C5X6_9PEZI|nr:hypothetical protein CBER1_09969 [Cercospora berteroae]